MRTFPILFALPALALSFCPGEAPAQQRLAVWVDIAPPSGSYLDYEAVSLTAGPRWRNLTTGALTPIVLPPDAPAGAPLDTTDVVHLQGSESAAHMWSPSHPRFAGQRSGYLFDRATGAPAYRRVARYQKVVLLP